MRASSGSAVGAATRTDATTRPPRTSFGSAGTRPSGAALTVRRLHASVGRRESEAERRKESQNAVAQVQQQLTQHEQQYQKLATDAEQQLQSALKESGDRIRKLLADAEDRFQKVQEARGSRFDSALEEIKAKATTQLETISRNGTDRIAEFDEEIDTYRQTLADRLQEVEKVVGAVAQTGMIGGYL